MTPEQIKWAMKLGACRFLPGTAQKRFAISMDAMARAKPAHVLTPKQAEYLELMTWRYRAQTGYKGPNPPSFGREVRDRDLGLIDLRNVGSP